MCELDTFETSLARINVLPSGVYQIRGQLVGGAFTLMPSSLRSFPFHSTPPLRTYCHFRNARSSFDCRILQIEPLEQ